MTHHDVLSQTIHAQETVSPEDIHQAVETLSKLEKGMLPYELFLQMARLATLSTIELVPIRESDNGTEVLLTQRPAGDIWEHQWHVPGTVILPTDPLEHPNDYSAPLARLIGQDGELRSGVRAVSSPVEVRAERRKTERGDELSVIHYVEVEGEPTVGTFFSAEELPKNIPSPGMIPHHADFVARTIEAYLQDAQHNV